MAFQPDGASDDDATESMNLVRQSAARAAAAAAAASVALTRDALTKVALAAVALETLYAGKGTKESPLSVIVSTIGVDDDEASEAEVVTEVTAVAEEEEAVEVVARPSSIDQPRSATSSRLSSSVPERRAMPAVGLMRSVELETSTAALSTAAAGTVSRTSSA